MKNVCMVNSFSQTLSDFFPTVAGKQVAFSAAHGTCLLCSFSDSYKFGKRLAPPPYPPPPPRFSL